MSVDKTLKQRSDVHGDFSENSEIAMALFHTIQKSGNYSQLTPVQQNALQLICNKIGRICAGDPDHADHWHDIQGYAKLVEDRISKTATNCFMCNDPLERDEVEKGMCKDCAKM